jgi:concentrative nucleoside transporter, CNT family
MPQLISLLGLGVMIGCAWLLSSQRRKISLRIIVGGVALQFALGMIALWLPPGRAAFEWMGEMFQRMLQYITPASTLMFGMESEAGNGSRTTQLLGTFAFGVLPIIIFFSALMAMLYHLGIMQRLVAACGWIMQRTLRTSGAESLAAAANIFVGMTEAPLVVRPYIAKMTMSELNALMVGGFATIAGSVLAAYVKMGIDPTHLLTASIMSAPAALMVAKMMEPETETPETLGVVKVDIPIESTNLVEATAMGASDGLKLALNVGAMIIAFIAILAMVNGIIGWCGDYFFDQKWSLEAGLSYAFWPFAWLMGIEQGDCFKAGELLGLRFVANEFIAYDLLATWQKPDSGVELSERSRVLLTYALCGFANLGSIGIQIGGIGALVPERRTDLAKLGFRAMIGGTLACFMTACVAGVLIP